MVLEQYFTTQPMCWPRPLEGVPLLMNASACPLETTVQVDQDEPLPARALYCRHVGAAPFPLLVPAHVEEIIPL